MEDFLKISRVRFISIREKRFPAVSLGTSPFIGAGQFGTRGAYYRRYFYDQPENMVSLIVHAAELGVPCVQLLAIDRILDAFREAKRRTGVDLACTMTVGIGDRAWELKKASEINPQVLFLHGMITDRLDLKGIEGWLKDIDKLNLIAGCVTHRPKSVLPPLIGSGLPIDAYMVPLNKDGIFMDCEPEELVKILESSGKPVIAKKVLAGGRISPGDGIPFVAQYKKVDGIAIGIASIEEMEESFSIAISCWKI
jgi:glycosyltransferase involved in cell wall biosynthesis